AAIALELPEKAELPTLALDLLATNDDLGRVEPGDLVRSICFPHAAIFDPSAAAFPIVRLGCVASYPVRPTAKQPTFLIDCNTFEGDSGGLVYWPDTNKEANGAGVKILGLVQGQHFVNLRYDFPYESGEIRKQLGLAIVIPASVIRETVDQLTKK
ncbi:MAG TPA: hypothetical protein VL096_12065, partial [Pirellulaceae bacterium]|nr:hypothetical protein [Pirellulaceae bacterium]